MAPFDLGFGVLRGWPFGSGLVWLGECFWLGVRDVAWLDIKFRFGSALIWESVLNGTSCGCFKNGLSLTYGRS